MRFELDALQKALVAEVDQVYESLGRDADPRKVMEHLGRERLLAVHYPVRYGGRGLPLAAHAAVCERLGELELPDVAHLISVQAVGCTILAYGTDAQKDRYLPGIAGGLLFASILLSETGAGSDLAGIETTAVGEGSGWRISGTKAWSIHTDWSGLALCSARTRRGGNRYDGISLFLIDLAIPGVRLVPVARASGTPYFTVILDGVYVGEDALLGRLHQGWTLLPKAIGFERTGFDYLTRATRWLEAAETMLRRLTAAEQAELAADLVGCRSKIESARALSYHAVNSAQGLDMDEIAVAYAKLACGRAAQAVARWAGREFSAALTAKPGQPEAREAAVLRAAVEEAPEFTVSGGAHELQLDLIASEFPIGAVVR
jgi:alkylation response protein AidB-like acyl-CoA dehydrogenase